MGLVQIDPLWLACVLFKASVRGILFRSCNFLFFFFEVPFVPSFCQVSAFEEIAREANSV